MRRSFEIDNREVSFAGRPKDRSPMVSIGELVLFYSGARDRQAHYRGDEAKKGRCPILGVYTGIEGTGSGRRTMIVFEPAMILLPQLQLGKKSLPLLLPPRQSSWEYKYRITPGDITELSIGKEEILGKVRESDAWLQQYSRLIQGLRRPYVVPTTETP